MWSRCGTAVIAAAAAVVVVSVAGRRAASVDIVANLQRPRPSRLSAVTTGVTDDLIVSHGLVDCPFDSINVAQWDCSGQDLSHSDAFLVPTAFIKTDPSKLRSTTVGGGVELPCSPDDEDCDEFSGELELATTRDHLIISSSSVASPSSRPSRRPPRSTMSTPGWTSSTTKSTTTTTTAAWRPWTTAPPPISYDPRFPVNGRPTAPDLDRVLPRPSDHPLDVGTARLDELDQLKLNVALIIGVAVCFSLLLLTLVLVVYRYRVAGVVVGGRRPRSAGDKAAAYSYETCNTLPPPTPVAVDPGRPLIVVNRGHAGGGGGTMPRPATTDATATIPRRDVKEWFV